MIGQELVDAIERAARKLPKDQVHMLAAALERHEGPSGAARLQVTNVAATPVFRDMASALVDAWSSNASELPGGALALALRSAMQSVESERREETIEVVWTGPHTNEVPVRLTSSALLDVIAAAEQSLIIASFAAYKVDLILDALKSAAGRGVRIRIILETAHVAGGTLTFAARSAFESLKDAAAFYIWPAEKRPELPQGRASLHVKAAVADEHTALVTSANFTGYAIAENMELGLLVRGGPVPRRLSRHFLQLIEDGILERQL